MYEELTPESIKAEMLAQIATMDTREGAFANTLLSPVALSIWETLQRMNALLPIAFVDETSGSYIDRRAGEFGIVRRPGTKAVVTLVFAGDNGVRVPAGTVFLTSGGLEYRTKADAVIAGGAATVTAEAAEIGARYNAPAESITRQYVNLTGLQSVTNSEAAAGGTDNEADASLLARLYAYWRRPITSGNAYHYEMWAKEADGVGAVKVFPLAQGPGTVDVVITDTEGLPAEAGIVADCQAHIDSVRPIGATVTVESAVALDILVQTVLRVSGSRSFAEIEAEIASRVQAHIRSIAFAADTLLYNRIAYLILDTEGVVDYTTLLINGGESNIPIGAREIAVLDGVEVSMDAT